MIRRNTSLSKEQKTIAQNWHRKMRNIQRPTTFCAQEINESFLETESAESLDWAIRNYEITAFYVRTELSSTLVLLPHLGLKRIARMLWKRIDRLWNRKNRIETIFLSSIFIKTDFERYK